MASEALLRSGCSRHVTPRWVLHGNLRLPHANLLKTCQLARKFRDQVPESPLAQANLLNQQTTFSDSEKTVW